MRGTTGPATHIVETLLDCRMQCSPGYTMQVGFARPVLLAPGAPRILEIAPTCWEVVA